MPERDFKFKKLMDVDAPSPPTPGVGVELEDAISDLYAGVSLGLDWRHNGPNLPALFADLHATIAAALAQREQETVEKRDRLWCNAIAFLPIEHMKIVLDKFGELRPDVPRNAEGGRDG